MIIGTNVRIALRALQINKLRSTLTMLGIIFGVSSVIATVAVGTGAQNRVQEEIRGIGSNIIAVSPGSANSSGVRMGAGSRMTITDADASAIQAEVPSVLVASPILRGSGQAVFANSNWTSPIFGVTPQYLVAREWAVVDGRGLEQEDVDSARKVALIGRTVADRLFLGADPVDAVVRIDRVPFRIVGVLDRKGQSMGGQDMDDVILMPLTTARNRLLGRIQANARLVTQISVKIREGGDMNAAMEQISGTVRAQAPPSTLAGRRFHAPQHLGDPQGQGRDFPRHDPVPDCGRVGVAARRRRWDHECHARQCDRANPRDRTPDGDGGQKP